MQTKYLNFIKLKISKQKSLLNILILKELSLTFYFLSGEFFHHEILINSKNEFKTIEDSNFLYTRIHPNIVKYKDKFENETNNTIVFITEYCNVSF